MQWKILQGIINRAMHQLAVGLPGHLVGNLWMNLSNDGGALEHLLAELGKRLQSSEIPTADELIRNYPQLESEVQRLLPALNTMASLKDASGSDGNGNENAARHQLGSHKIGNFQILRQIGRGGMGIVYEACELSVNRMVALKVLPAAALLDEQMLVRFRNEARAAATLVHPNIVSVYTVGEDRGIHYYAMQLVRGHSLAEVIRGLRELSEEAGCLDGSSITGVVSAKVVAASKSQQDTSCVEHSEDTDPTAPSVSRQERAAVRQATRIGPDYYRRVAELGVQAARALQEAHRQSILHRDIKPGNLLIDQQGQLFVADFGLARIENDPEMTLTGDVMGTLRYMSPEQIGGDRARVDRHTDIYSLGATLYELTALCPMFSVGNQARLIQQITNDEATDLHKIHRAIPRDLSTIVAKATRKEPAERYATAGEMADDLQRFLDCKPIVARHQNSLHRWGMWCRRNPGFVGAMVAALLLVTIGLLISNVMILRQKNIANQKTTEAKRLQQLADERADAERLAKEQAEELMEQTGDYNEILQAIFDDFDPRTRDSTAPPLESLLANRLIEAGQKIAEGEYEGSRYQINLLMQLGNTLINLGYPEEAFKLFLRCEEIIDEQLADSGEDWVGVISNYLGRAYLSNGKPELAISAYQRAYEVYQNLDTKVENELSCLHGLAIAFLLIGQYDRSITILEDVVPRRIDASGVEARQTMTSMNVLATAYHRSGRLKPAENEMRRVHQLRSKVFQPDSVDAANSASNLAAVLMELGKDNEALGLLLHAEQAMQARLTDSHPSTNTVRTNLAIALQHLGRHTEATQNIDTAKRNLVERYGGTHSRSLRAKRVFADLAMDVNQIQSALEVLGDSYQASFSEHGADSPDTLDLGVYLAKAQLLSGDIEGASDLANQVIGMMNQQRRFLGHSTTLSAHLVLACAERMEGEPHQAIERIQNVVNLVNQDEDALPTRNLLMLQIELAAAYRDQGNLPDSAKELESLRREWAEALQKNHPLMILLVLELQLSLIEAQDWLAAAELQIDLVESVKDVHCSDWLKGRLKLQSGLVHLNSNPRSNAIQDIEQGISMILAASGRLNAFQRFQLKPILTQVQESIAQIPRFEEQDVVSTQLTQLYDAIGLATDRVDE